MLPAFDEYGNLPPGIHPATWEEIVARFGQTSERRWLLIRMRAALDILATAGCRRIWLDGSMVTDVEARRRRPPRDVDVCWDLADVDVGRLATLAPELDPLRGDRDAQFVRFGGDYFGVSEPFVTGMIEDFQWDRNRRRKGIILLTLEGKARPG